MNNNPLKNREYFLDIAKGIGISLVILDHSAIGKSIINYTYVFNIPLFFFIAGYLLNLNKYQNYWQFLKSRLKSILIPYLGLSIISIVFYKFYYRMPMYDYATMFNMLKVLVIATRNQIFYNIPLWFLPTLFVTENIFYWIRKINHQWWEWTVILILGVSFVVAWDTVYNPKLFWTIDSGCFYLVFLALGYYIKNQTINIKNLNNRIKNIMFIGALMINSLVIYNKAWFEKIFRNKIILNNGVLYFVSLVILAMAGIYVVLKLSKIIGHSKILEFIGRNSLTFFGLHVLIFWILDKIFKPMTFWQNKILLLSVIYTIITMAIIALLIAPLKKYWPWIFGRNT